MNSTPSSLGAPLVPAVHLTLKALPSRLPEVRHAVTSVSWVWTGLEVTPGVFVMLAVQPVPPKRRSTRALERHARRRARVERRAHLDLADAVARWRGEAGVAERDRVVRRGCRHRRVHETGTLGDDLRVVGVRPSGRRRREETRRRGHSVHRELLAGQLVRWVRTGAQLHRAVRQVDVAVAAEDELDARRVGVAVAAGVGRARGPRPERRLVLRGDVDLHPVELRGRVGRALVKRTVDVVLDHRGVDLVAGVEAAREVGVRARVHDRELHGGEPRRRASAGCTGRRFPSSSARGSRPSGS